ncbi:MAG: outer membrane protein assembly factor BamB family protein [Alkalilacustris sp.]
MTAAWRRTRRRVGALWGIGLSALVLAGCERELILEGERLDPRALTVAGPAQVPPNRAVPVALVTPVDHAAWTHRGGTPAQRIAHPAFSTAPAVVWSAPIGEGADRRQRLTADPVAADGRIFTLDARSTVTATGRDGARLWQVDVRPDWAGRGMASGGGLALGAGRLFVTSAYGLLVALEPASGAVLWSRRFEAPLTAPPAVADGRVFVVGSDGTGWAIDAATGQALWQLPGVPSAAGMVGGAAPAVAGGRVLMPFASGDVVGASAATGAQDWRTRVAGQRLGRTAALVTDIAGDPVVVDGTVFVGNRSGRVAALDAASGAIRWSAREGAFGPVWPAGDSLFLVSDQGELVRLQARDGSRIWGVPLGHFLEARERRRAETVAHFGPVLAGGRLLVASSDGFLRSFDPASGALLAETALPGGAASRPVVVERTLYVVTRDGRLHALR